MKLNFLAESAVFVKAKFTLSFCIHINLIPIRDIVLVFTDGTD